MGVEEGNGATPVTAGIASSVSGVTDPPLPYDDATRKIAEEKPLTDEAPASDALNLARLSVARDNKGLFRMSGQPLFRPSGGGLARASVGTLALRVPNETLARMSQNAAGWREDDTAELTQAVVEQLNVSAEDKEKASRRQSQLHKIDVGETLNTLERISLAEAALEEGVETYLQRVQATLEENGYELPTIEVRYREVIVEMEAIVGSTTLPTLLQGTKDAVLGVINMFPGMDVGRGAKRTIRVLKNLNGVLMPGTATLVLGQPGAGKSSFLRTLSGRITTYPNPRTVVNGEITYNGKTFDQFVVKKTAAYVDEREIHYAHLTVRETFGFAAKCLGQGALPKMLKEVREKQQETTVTAENAQTVEDLIFLAAAEGRDELYVELIIKLLRLSNAADTIVGDNMTRGCSGGEKRRVTSGEYLVGPYHCFFLDEISNGLDAPGAYAICSALCEYAKYWKATFCISLQQPEPQTYALFDEVIVLAEGRELYHGPREHVLNFFNSIGLYMPDRKETSDFLQEVASPMDQTTLRLCNPEGDVSGGKYMPPRYLEREWKESPLYAKMMERLAEQVQTSKSSDMAFATEKFALNTTESLRVLFERYWILEHREWIITGYRFLQSTLMAIVTGSFATRKTAQSLLDGMQLMGILYFSLMYMILDSVPVVAITFERKRVFLKQRDNYFFPAWAFSWPMTFIELPVLLAQVIIYCVIEYFWIGFAGTAGQFFIFLVVHFFVLTWADSLYRIIGAAAPTLTVGNNVASFLLLIILATSGFTVFRFDMGAWWQWALWINPYAWGIRSLAINEMHSGHWYIDAPRYRARGERWFEPYQNHGNLGKYVLVEYQLQTAFWWVWAGIAYIVIIWTAFMFIPPFVFSILPEARKQLVISEDNPFEPKGVVTVELKDLSTKRSRGSMRLDAAGDAARGSAGPATTQAAGGEAKAVPVAAPAPGPKPGVSLPFEPANLVFRDIDYFVPHPAEKGQELQLLKKIWGAFRPSILTALMGASGAGKTTLMDLIAGRKSVGRIEGNIFLNGHPKVQSTFARVMGYVEQFDIHSPCLTIRESLQFSAALRLPREVDEATKLLFVDQQMDIVELTPLSGMMVGVPGESGLSHEQRKRMTIAVELVANPSVIFMDEPTTGLDARAAAIVMRVVRNIANSNRTVTCTIHQPSTEIFENFDQLLMMKRGGWVVYFGDIGEHSDVVIRHFESFPEVPRFQAGMNPSSWALDVTSGNIPGMPDFAEIYANSDLHRENCQLINDLAVPPPGTQPLAFKTSYATGPLTQVRWLSKKFFITYWRTPSYNLTRFSMTIVIALVLGTLYLGLGWTSRWDYIRLTESFGCIYLGAMFLGTGQGFSVQPVVAMERTVFYRERAARTYSVPPYVLAETFVELPYGLVQALLYSSIIYFLVNWASGAGAFFTFFFLNYLSLIAFTYSGMLLVHVTPNVQLASVLASGVYGFWKLWAGYIVPYNSFSNFYVWGFWLNPLTYVVYGITVWQYGEVYEPIYFGGTWFSVTQWLNSYYGYKHSFMYWNAGCLILMCVFFRVCSYLAMNFLNFLKR